MQWRRCQAVVRIGARSHIISSWCSLQLPDRRRGRCGEPCPPVPPAGPTAPSPPGCRWAAPRSGRPCLWAAALAGPPCCARFRSQNTQGDLKKINKKSSLTATVSLTLKGKGHAKSCQSYTVNTTNPRILHWAGQSLEDKIIT